MLFELKDLEGESCGLVKVTNFEEGVAEMDDDMNIVDPLDEVLKVGLNLTKVKNTN